MVQDDIARGIHFSEAVMAREKKKRIGSSDPHVLPMKFFLFDQKGGVTALVSTPFRPNHLDERDQMFLAVRLFAHALDARAVFHLTEAWVANRCAQCGKQAPMQHGCCTACGGEVVPPAKNHYGEEMLVGSLAIKDHPKAFCWTSRFKRAQDGAILGFEDVMRGEPMGVAGALCQVWSLEEWMSAHFAVNLPQLLEALNKPVDPRLQAVARLAEEHLPPGYEIVRLDLDLVKRAVSRMTCDEDDCH